jgi:hypothetical protein
MSKYDPMAADRIAASILSHQNPVEAAGDDLDELNEAKVTEFFEALHREGVQMSSLRESKLREHCHRMGLNDSQVTMAIEEWMSWGVTDDVSEG